MLYCVATSILYETMHSGCGVSIRAFDGPCSQYAAVMLDRCAAHAAAHEAPPAFGYVLELQPFTVAASAD